MNIHIEETHLDYLRERSIFQTVIGSKLYGTGTEKSDTDILYLYVESIDELNNPFFTHHQFQIKKDGIDHIFTSVRQFCRNLILGDSSINLDVLMLTNIEEIIPPFVLVKQEVKQVYPILKCLLGLAKRDLKLSTHRKKINHAKRGLFCFNALRTKGHFTKEDIQQSIQEDLTKEALQDLQKRYRTQLNEDYNQGQLTKYLSASTQQTMIAYLQQLQRPTQNQLLLKLLEANNIKEFRY